RNSGWIRRCLGGRGARLRRGLLTESCSRRKESDSSEQRQRMQKNSMNVHCASTRRLHWYLSSERQVYLSRLGNSYGFCNPRSAAAFVSGALSPVFSAAL